VKGSKRERTPGVWELRVYAGKDRLTGRKRYVSRTHRGGARSAEDALRALIRQVAAEPAERPDQVTVAELLDRWWRLRQADWSPTTARDHRNAIDAWIRPRIGEWLVAEVRPADLERFYGQLAARGGRAGRGLSPTTVRKVHSILHAAFEDAVRWELLDRNPAARARRPKLVRHTPTVPTLDQVRAAVAAADPAMAAIIRVAVATGARRGELVALRWGDLDLEVGTVHVRRSVAVVDGRPVVKPTKTGASAVVAIDPGTVEVLQAWRRDLREMRMAAGLGRLRSADWVWPAADLEGPMTPDHVTYRWGRLADQVGVPDARFHDLRHAAATQLVAAGVDVRTVAGRLRHASPAMTLDVYASRDLDADRAAAGVIGHLLDG
jgi:integrase